MKNAGDTTALPATTNPSPCDKICRRLFKEEEEEEDDDDDNNRAAASSMLWSSRG